MSNSPIRDWNEMYNHVAKKYNVKLDDYGATEAGIERSSQYNVDHKDAWERKRFPEMIEWEKNPEPGMRFSAEGGAAYRKRFDEITNAYLTDPDGRAKEIPFRSYWHFILDVYDNIANDTILRFSFATVLERCEQDWQREITQLFINEFGAEEMLVEFSW